MAQQTINVGTNPNDGTGDTLRGAFIKTDDNFTELYSGKQNTLISGTNIKTINGNSILGNGNLTISGGITGSGTDNYIPRFNGTTALENSIIFDNATNVGIGTSSPVDKLDVNGSLRLRGNTPLFTAANNSGVIDFVPTSIFPTDPQMRIAALGSSTVGASILFQTGVNSGSITERMRLTPEGFLGIGTSAPFTKLCVDGTFFAGDVAGNLPYISIDTASATITTPGTLIKTSGLVLIDGSGEIGLNPGGDTIGLKFHNDYGVWFINDQNNKFGLSTGDNSLFAQNNIIQTGSVPYNEFTPTSWIRIYNFDTNTSCFIPVYE